ncbi:sugar transferase [Parvibaculaceae bacterium PLY_AMNH_Bact1]|nr:sugar transferase [Parvibaculaceae bacterium PLY_AMNH_Bact1]
MFDIIVAASALVLLMGVYGVVAIAILVDVGRPIFFKQTRTGFAGVPFEIIKFRTMRNAIAADGSLLPDGERLTPLGRFLRSTSLDELPELWNVLKGNMSLVGPRPLLPEYLPHYSVDEKRRLEVRPGLTGLAQVRGRNSTTWERRFELDVEYVENMSFLSDLKILFLTVWRVASREGISAEGHATMPRFDDYVRSGRRTDGNP